MSRRLLGSIFTKMESNMRVNSLSETVLRNILTKMLHNMRVNGLTETDLCNILTNMANNIRVNPLSETDVYKLGHMDQYVPGCDKVYSGCIARKNLANFPTDNTVMFGLQYILKEHLSQTITHTDVDQFMIRYEAVLGSKPSDDIVKKFRQLAKLGYWPVKIKAVPEGTVLPNKNILFSITNTHPDFYWAVGYIETMILKVWYPITVATTSYHYKLLVHKFFKETVSDTPFVDFQVHDFGARGSSSEESCMIDSMAHLTCFTGSDSMIAIDAAMQYYKANLKTLMGSVPASEHSVMCSFGKEHEIEAFQNMLDKYPTGIVSIVSDTYDLWKVLTEYAVTLRDQILTRDGKVVFRPDSGNPVDIICGDPKADPNTPAGKGCIRLLDELFGSTINEKGYKVLNPKVGLIYGDGMNLTRYETALTKLKEMGYASSNLIIGVGGLLRWHSRDSLGFAIKATNIEVNGKSIEIMKDPITDPGKKSHKGLMKLVYENGTYVTYDQVSKEEEETGLLQTVFENGKVVKEYTFDEIRASINSNFK